MHPSEVEILSKVERYRKRVDFPTELYTKRKYCTWIKFFNIYIANWTGYMGCTYLSCRFKKWDSV